MKQIVASTSTNNAEVSAVHEAARKAVWLRTMVSVIFEQYDTSSGLKAMMIFEDNAESVAHVSTGFIKADRIKHINPTLFGFMEDLVETNQVKIKKIDCTHNIADMLTKVFFSSKHKEMVRATRIRSLQDLL